jgi:hypothetical protein
MTEKRRKTTHPKYNRERLNLDSKPVLGKTEHKPTVEQFISLQSIQNI